MLNCLLECVLFCVFAQMWIDVFCSSCVCDLHIFAHSHLSILLTSQHPVCVCVCVSVWLDRDGSVGRSHLPYSCSLYIHLIIFPALSLFLISSHSLKEWHKCNIKLCRGHKWINKIKWSDVMYSFPPLHKCVLRVIFLVVEWLSSMTFYRLFFFPKSKCT